MGRGTWQVIVHGVTKSWMKLSTRARAHTHTHTHTHTHKCVCVILFNFFQHIFIEFQLCAVEIQRAGGLDNSEQPQKISYYCKACFQRLVLRTS